MSCFCAFCKLTVVFFFDKNVCRWLGCFSNWSQFWLLGNSTLCGQIISAIIFMIDNLNSHFTVLQFYLSFNDIIPYQFIIPYYHYLLCRIYISSSCQVSSSFFFICRWMPLLHWHPLHLLTELWSTISYMTLLVLCYLMGKFQSE